MYTAFYIQVNNHASGSSLKKESHYKTHHILSQQVQLVALELRDLEPEAVGLSGNAAGGKTLAALLQCAPRLVCLRRAHALQSRVAVRIHRLIELQFAVQRAVVALGYNPLLGPVELVDLEAGHTRYSLAFAQVLVRQPLEGGGRGVRRRGQCDVTRAAALLHDGEVVLVREAVEGARLAFLVVLLDGGQTTAVLVVRVG